MNLFFRELNALRCELAKVRAELDEVKAQFKRNDLLTRVETLENKGRPST